MNKLREIHIKFHTPKRELARILDVSTSRVHRLVEVENLYDEIKISELDKLCAHFEMTRNQFLGEESHA